MDPWQTLTTDYEQRRAREESLDQLMEWDAQYVGIIVFRAPPV